MSLGVHRVALPGLRAAAVRQAGEVPALPDFRGDAARGDGYEKDRANVHVIDGDGRIALKMTGAATAEGLGRVYAEVDRPHAARR